MDNGIKAVAIGGNVDSNGELELFICLGAFSEVESAYGEALLFLTDVAESIPDEKYTLTVPVPLDNDTGYGMYLKDKNGNSVNYAFVLFNHKTNESEENNNG